MQLFMVWTEGRAVDRASSVEMLVLIVFCWGSRLAGMLNQVLFYWVKIVSWDWVVKHINVISVSWLVHVLVHSQGCYQVLQLHSSQQDFSYLCCAQVYCLLPIRTRGIITVWDYNPSQLSCSVVLKHSVLSFSISFMGETVLHAELNQ